MRNPRRIIWLRVIGAIAIIIGAGFWLHESSDLFGLRYPRVVYELFERVEAIPLQGDNDKSRAGSYGRNLYSEIEKLSDPERSRLTGVVQNNWRKARGESTDEKRPTPGWLYGVGTTLTSLYIETGQRAKLQEMLMTVDCTLPGYVYLEFLLVVRYGHKADMDGILVLLDAYDQGSMADVRAANLRAIRRAFAAQAIRATGDEAYVAACRDWYLKNRDALEVNDEYVHTYMTGDFDDDLATIKNPVALFKPKTGAGTTPVPTVGN